MALCRAMLSISVSLACLLPAFVAQTSSAQDTGTIQGHVYGADTNAPIRIGTVMLKVASQAKAPGVGWGAVCGCAATATLRLDGSFVFPHVRPGRYLVYASAPGYLSPFDSPESSSRSEGKPVSLNPVSVELGPNQTVQANFELQRGAAVRRAKEIGRQRFAQFRAGFYRCASSFPFWREGFVAGSCV